MSETTVSVKPKKPITVLLSCILLLLTVLLYLIYIFSPLPCFSYGVLTNELKDSELYGDMQSGKSFCFVGDSITCGSEAYGTPWYRHLEKHITGDVSNFSHGGWTSKVLVRYEDNIPEADIYVIAIGINDVLFFDKSYSAHDAEEYILALEELTDYLEQRSPGAKFYYITPWPAFDRPEEVNTRFDEYIDALKGWCSDNGKICIDPRPYIIEVVEAEGQERYMFNTFHPNKRRGVGLYAYAVMQAEHQRSGTN